MAVCFYRDLAVVGGQWWRCVTLKRSLSEGTEHREFAKRVSVEAEVLPRTVRYCYRLHRYGSDEPLSLDLFRELESGIILVVELKELDTVHL
ncbi:hypothetical protein RRG08_003646 [Elysia crispata]|uniref:Uncharacterized protein n=1 Tax=Elysia crispata TaxID=231223 RepID=A0AAE1AVJ2_9GAST|nr:hypothetical protein RRG08_003646 [Elysia crispata]